MIGSGGDIGVRLVGLFVACVFIVSTILFLMLIAISFISSFIFSFISSGKCMTGKYGDLRRADRTLYYGFEHYIEPWRVVDVLCLLQRKDLNKSLRQLV